jgi:hypothetical protein
MIKEWRSVAKLRDHQLVWIIPCCRITLKSVSLLTFLEVLATVDARTTENRANSSARSNGAERNVLAVPSFFGDAKNS